MPAPINSRPNVVVRSPTPFGLGRNGCWPSQGSQLSRAFPFIFSLCCPLNDRRSAAHSFFKIGRLFSLFLFSCTPLALLCLLILLLLLMSGNVHPKPGPMFPLLCVRWKCDLAGQVSTMLRLLQIGPSKVLTTFPLQNQSSWQLSLLELPPPLSNHCGPSSDSSNMYTSTVQSGLPSTNAALLPHPHLQIYPQSAHYISSPPAPSTPSLAPGCPSLFPASTPP